MCDVIPTNCLIKYCYKWSAINLKGEKNWSIIEKLICANLKIQEKCLVTKMKTIQELEPPDGGYGWVIVVASAINFVSTVEVSNI